MRGDPLQVPGPWWGKERCEEEGVAEWGCQGLSPVFLHSLCCLVRKNEDSRCDAVPEKKQEEGVNFCFCFSLSNSILTGTKLI